jgi:serine/threonine-protein kinase
MTPGRWRLVGELFEAAVRIGPVGREDWLRHACDGDEELRAEVRRLLAQDQQADRDGFLTPPEPAESLWDRTPTWPRHLEDVPQRPGPSGKPGNVRSDDASGFTPRQAIAPRVGRKTISEPPEVVRARLRELPLVYVLILAGSIFWRHAVFGQQAPSFDQSDAAIILSLLGIVAVLWQRWPISLAWLKAMELGTIGLLAGRSASVQYRLMLEFSQRGDKMMAQLTMKNIVLMCAVLILTYGLYVPKSWRRTAVVVGPLALLPFAVLGTLVARHPVDMAWLWEGWKYSDVPRVLLFIFDANVLLILAVGATYGAHTLSRLRLQVAEARQLGQYRLGQRIGAGGMGEVYLAEHMLLKRPCAVKLVRPACASNPRALGRFEREVRLTATLSHPNTVEVYDYGLAEDGTYYYVMEYLDGLSLTELVEQYGPLPPGRVVYLLRQVCGALREAHAAGLVHRDIKPSNIFAARRGGMDDVAKLLDFGLVLPPAQVGAPQLSGEGQVLGTPQFMPPEQAIGGGEVDGRSDIYATGAVGYYLLTGRPPFDGDSGVGLLIAHARDPVLPPSAVCADVPEDLERVVLHCLAKDPAKRFPDAGALERALDDCACAGDWDRDRAAQWWREVGTPARRDREAVRAVVAR